MSEFSYRLKTLRKEIGLTQDKLAEKIGFSKSAIVSWEKGIKKPNLDAIITLAEFFDVASDYLLGLCD